MKITKSQLTKLIREMVEQELQEAPPAMDASGAETIDVSESTMSVQELGEALGNEIGYMMSSSMSKLINRVVTDTSDKDLLEDADSASMIEVMIKSAFNSQGMQELLNDSAEMVLVKKTGRDEDD